MTINASIIYACKCISIYVLRKMCSFIKIYVKKRYTWQLKVCMHGWNKKPEPQTLEKTNVVQEQTSTRTVCLYCCELDRGWREHTARLPAVWQYVGRVQRPYETEDGSEK